MAKLKCLEVLDLGHKFGPAEVLRDVDLSVSEGESVAVVGPSGSGKTTLLRLCGGLLEASVGSISNSFQRPAYAFQAPLLLPWQSALDNIAFGLKAQGMARQQRLQWARDIGHRLGLDDADLKKFPGDLSGGMRQRVSFSRALLTYPDLLFLDEPFSALDIGLKRELQQLLLDEVTARGMAIFFITHDLMEAVRLADRILLLAGTPGPIVNTFTFSRPPAERDDEYVYLHTARLLSEPDIKHHFELDGKTQR